MSSLFSASQTPLSHLSVEDTPGHQDDYVTQSIEQDLGQELVQNPHQDLDPELDQEMQTDGSYVDEDGDEPQEPESDGTSLPQEESLYDKTPMLGNYDYPGGFEAEISAHSLRRGVRKLSREIAASEKHQMKLEADANVKLARVSLKIYHDLSPLIARLKEKVQENQNIVEDCPDKPFPLPGNGRHVSKSAFIELLHSLHRWLDNMGKCMDDMTAGSVALSKPPNNTGCAGFFSQPQSGVQQAGSNFAPNSAASTTQMSRMQTSFEGLYPSGDQENQAVNGNTEQFGFGQVAADIGATVQGDVTCNIGSFGNSMPMSQGNFGNGNTLVPGANNILFVQNFKWDK